MSSKTDSILQKVAQERARGDFSKALKRLADAINKDGSEFCLFTEAIEVALEATDSLQASTVHHRQPASPSARSLH